MEPSSGKAFPESLAAALADGAAIDWRAAELNAGGAPHADLVHQLRVIAAMRGRQGTALTAARPWLRHFVVATFAGGVAVAAIKVLVALAGVPAALARVSPAPVAPFVLNLAIFGIGGLLLVVGGGRDRRLQLLGGLYLTIASAFVDPFLVQPAGPANVLVHLLVLSKPEVFMALGVWLFAWTFPQEPVTRSGRAVAAGFLAASLGLVALMFAINIVRQHHLWPDAPAVITATFAALNRNAPKSLYWPLLFGLALPAIPFLLAKSLHVGHDGRRRVQLFLVALGLGFLPIVAAVIATPFVPAFRDPAVRQRVGLGLYLALGSIVPMTAYAVAVSRVMDIQFVIRATLQYALARYAIWAVILAPMSYLAVDVFVNRGLTFLQYVDARHPAGVLMLSGAGLVALTFRPHLVQAVDRWFRREPLDSALALARLEHRFRASEHLREISLALGEELTAALHADRVAVLLQGEDGAALVALDGATPALPHGSVLCELLRATRSEVRVDARAAIVRLLPEADQDWLVETGAELLAPLVGSSGTLLGVVAIGAATRALPYTASHEALVTAMCGHAAMQLENRWLRETQAVPGGLRAPRVSGVAWQDEPATWCPNCSVTSSSETRRCRCGAATRPAVLPLFVNAKFRLQRFLGAGGTGVVYLATDLALDRQVAIKTLPAMRREYAERLRREARAMAAVRHPNLATIYGAEEWHDTPLLIVEFLEGGTLFDWLARGPADIDEVLDLGIMLADALDRVHGSGVLHRDIKPSNIGYSADGVPKLLDFGLAAILDRSQGLDAAAAVMPVDPAELAARFSGLQASTTLTITQQVVGTPLYLSPEALAGAAPQPSFDLWSLNVVLYEAIAGRHPLAGQAVAAVVDAIQHADLPDLRTTRPDCPPFVAAFLGDALSRVPARRPATAGDLRTALRGLRARLETAR